MGYDLPAYEVIDENGPTFVLSQAEMEFDVEAEDKVELDLLTDDAVRITLSGPEDIVLTLL